VTEYRLPGGADPFGIAAGWDGNMWFTLPAHNRVGTITPAGAVTTFALPVAGSAPHAITPAPDGAMWFTQPGADDIGRITSAGTVSEYPVPTPRATPLGIATGLRGQVWFTEAGANRVAELAVAAPHTQYVAVGSGYVQQAPPRAHPGTTVQWTFTGPATQTVTDATGMGLYDSGPRAFVSAFTHTFTAAGDYPYRSSTTGITAVYKILPFAPRTGTTGAAFTVTWASAAPAAGFGFDVWVRPPGASAYEPWQAATTQRSAAFTPAAAGTYAFQARLVDTGATPQTSSGWSPTVAVTVS
jgi:plastocyanin